MLTLKYGNIPTLRRALNVHPQIPIAVTVNDKGNRLLKNLRSNLIMVFFGEIIR